MQQKILIFDFDGTLADTAEVAAGVYNDIADQQGFKKMEKKDEAYIRSLPARKVFKFLGVPVWKIPFLVPKIRKGLGAKIAHVSPPSGVAQEIRTLKTSGHEMYIVTSNSKENVEVFLQKNGLEGIFNIVSEFNFFGKHKSILKLIRQHGWQKSQVYYIGDEVRDVEAARKAGVNSVVVSWGYNSIEALEKAKPDVLVETPEELVKILE